MNLEDMTILGSLAANSENPSYRTRAGRNLYRVWDFDKIMFLGIEVFCVSCAQYPFCNIVYPAVAAIQDAAAQINRVANRMALRTSFLTISSLARAIR
jgi:hypothetical protein